MACKQFARLVPTPTYPLLTMENVDTGKKSKVEVLVGVILGISFLQ